MINALERYISQEEDFEIVRKNPVQKHGTHDQKTHGNWAKGIAEEMARWSPEDEVPASPKNKGSVPAKAWENWEHGPDGRQFVDLYRDRKSVV